MATQRGATQLSAGIIAAVFLAAIYLETTIVVSGILVPSAVTLVLLPVVAASIRNRIRMRDILLLLWVAIVGLSGILAWQNDGYINERMLGLLQLEVALVVGVCVYHLLVGLETRQLERTIGWLALGLFVLGVTEVLEITKDISDGFRHWVYAGGVWNVYENDQRDLGLVGWIRPKVFTTEPSHWVKGVVVFVGAWLMIRFTRRKLVIGVLVFGGLMVLTASPIALIGAGASVLSTALMFQRARRPAVLLVLGVTLFALAGVVVGGVSLFDRVTTVWSRLGDPSFITSENIRLVFPFLTAVDVLEVSPWVGSGVGAKERIGELATLDFATRFAIGNNGIATALMYFGVLGTVMLVGFGFIYWADRSAKAYLSAVVWLVALCGMMGGIETIRFWGFAFVVWAAIAKAESLHGKDSRFDRAPYGVPLHAIKSG